MLGMWLPARWCGDHPREYGENQDLCDLLKEQEGSSPRIRGKWVAPRCFCLGVRIIPANTGKMLRLRRPRQRGRDHPREYGENLSTRAATARPSGSSPRIRGKLPLQGVCSGGRRIIPANTGKMLKIEGLWYWVPDHPREYGENPPRL